MLARALAAEANVAFFAINGGALHSSRERRRLRRTFARARKSSAAVIFIDEFDSVGFSRAGQPGQTLLFGADSSLLQEILVQLDGFRRRGNVFVLATTNHKELLDPAALRPGRFDKVVSIPRPNRQARRDILTHYLARAGAELRSEELEALSRATLGLTGADLANLVNLAGFRAVRDGRARPTAADLDNAGDRLALGVTNTSFTQNREELYRTAVHECGHALVCLLRAPGFTVRKLTLLSKGGSLGHTAFVPETEEELVSARQIDGLMDAAMGGRAAEEVVFGEEEVTTGCGSDLQNATRNAFAKVYGYGLGPTLLVADVERLSLQYRFDLERAASDDLKSSYTRTTELLRRNKDALLRLAAELMERETLSGEEMKALLGLDG